MQAAALSAWRAVVGPTAGRALLLTHAELAAAYYLDMSRSQNHETSEAACAAMAELATVLPASTTATETVVRTMLQAVRACVQDPSWPVRDAALHSIAALLQHCSQAVLAVERDETADPAAEVPTLAMFLAACTAHLSDPLPSVRNNAAAALTMACSAADASISGPCFHHLLGMAATQLSNGNVQRVLHGPNADAAIDASAGLTAPVRPKAFLSPQALALLQKNAHAVQSSQRVAMDVPLPPPTPTPHSHPTPPLAEQPTYPLPPPSIPANAPRSQWRRGGGWGCCLDCMVVRDRTATDALQGTVALLHQLARTPLDLVGSHWTEALEEQLSSDSGAPYLTWAALPTGQAYDCNNSGKGLRVLWGLLRAAWELVWRLQQMLKASNGSSAASRMSSPSGTMQVQMLAHVLIALQEVHSSLNANDTAATAAQQVLGADPAIQIGAKDLFTAPTSLLASALIAKWDAVPILGLLEQVQAVANELGRSGTALRAAAEDSAQMLIELRNRC